MKSGMYCTEFWLSLLAIVASAVVSSGLVHDGGTVAKVLALVVSVLATLGYTAARTVLKLNAPHEPPAPKEPAKTIPVVPATVFLLLCLASSSMAGCCHLGGTCKSPQQVAVDCTKQVVKDNAPNVLVQVVAAFTTAPDVETALERIATSLGADGLLIVTCVAEQLYHQWTTEMAHAKPGADPQKAHALANVTAWLHKHDPGALK
jgi:hypothetical protein